jgi:hypothetical protein
MGSSFQLFHSLLRCSRAIDRTEGISTEAANTYYVRVEMSMFLIAVAVTPNVMTCRCIQSYVVVVGAKHNLMSSFMQCALNFLGLQGFSSRRIWR